jgi:tetratricopeptide (TPR) repeat protein
MAQGPVGESKLSGLCSKIMEVGWLLAVVITPLYFNVHSTRVFEPDKLTMLRSVALVMAGAWAVKWIEYRARGRKGTDLTWRTPLVLPTLCTVAVYLASTAFSIVPYVSVFGSYQRLQGTYTTLAYVVVFLVILQELRTRRQLDRLLTIVILNSLPIALYGFLQRSGQDPLPWAGDTETRITSSMGNPIFVAAYLIMAAPPTLARVVDCFKAILTDEDTGAGDVVRASAYIFIFLVQIAAIWFSGSRGPLMGLLAGLAVWAYVGLLRLQRAARSEAAAERAALGRDLLHGGLFGLATMAAAALVGLAARAASAPLGAKGGSESTIAAIAAAISVLGLWMGMIVTRRGWRWLWFSAVVIAVVLATAFLVVNLEPRAREWAQTQPWLGKLDDVLQSESGTGKVRSLIWQGSVELILPHAPIEAPPTGEYPEGWTDPFNLLRPLVGYGPESMYVAYNDFYPPELGHYESRTASPDRSHNETLDSLVITGLLGFGVYVWLFGGSFYFGLRWLGLLPPDWRRTAFFALMAGGAIVASAAVIPTLGVHFIALAIPVGMVGGLFVYLVLHGFSTYKDELIAQEHPHALLLTGILAGIVGHLIEINFGIAIAATRTTFWAYLGVFVVAGHGLLRQGAQVEQVEAGGGEPSRRRRRRRRRPRSATGTDKALREWAAPVLVSAVLVGFVLATLVYDFTTNTEELDGGLGIVSTMLRGGDLGAAHGAWLPLLILFVPAWLVSGAVLVAAIAREQREFAGHCPVPAAVLLFFGVSFLVAFGFSFALGETMAEMVRSPAETVTELAERAGTELVCYYGFVVFTMVVGGLALYSGERPWPRANASASGLVTLAVVAVLAAVAVGGTNVSPIRADIIQKVAASYENLNRTAVAVELYSAAIDLVPREDRYYLDLGRSLLDYSVATADASEREDSLQTTENVLLQAREISHLNTDHSANLARMYRSWAGLTAYTERQPTLVEESARNYRYATSLSPQNVLLWNEWAVLEFYYRGDEARYQELLETSIALDDGFYETWMIQADVHLVQREYAEAIPLLERALELDFSAQPEPGRPHWHWVSEGFTVPVNYPTASAWYAYGHALAVVEQYEESAAALDTLLDAAPTSAYAWDCHRLLAIAYANLGQPAEAIQQVQMALQMAPPEHVPVLEELLGQLVGSA